MFCFQGSEDNTNRGARLEDDFMSPTHDMGPSQPQGDLENTRLSDVIRTVPKLGWVGGCMCVFTSFLIIRIMTGVNILVLMKIVTLQINPLEPAWQLNPLPTHL